MRLFINTNCLLGLTVFFFSLPLLVSAQYAPLIPVPGLDPNNLDMETFLKTVYILAISIAALIAVGKLMLAGFKYIGSEIVTDKSEAKKDVQSAIIGLLIILLAVAILRTINTSLVNLPKLESAPYINGIPHKSFNVVNPTIDDIDDIKNQINSCKKLTFYNDNTRCCSDEGTCPSSGITSDYLVGLSPDKNVYTISEIAGMATTSQEMLQKTDPNFEIVNPPAEFTRKTLESITRDCQIAAEYRNKSLVEVVILYQLDTRTRAGLKNILQNPLCIMK